MAVLKRSAGGKKSGSAFVVAVGVYGRGVLVGVDVVHVGVVTLLKMVETALRLGI